MAAVQTTEEGPLSVHDKLASDGPGPGDGASGANAGAAGAKKKLKDGPYVPKCDVLIFIYCLSSICAFHACL